MAMVAWLGQPTASRWRLLRERRSVAETVSKIITHDQPTHAISDERDGCDALRLQTPDLGTQQMDGVYEIEAPVVIQWINRHVPVVHSSQLPEKRLIHFERLEPGDNPDFIQNPARSESHAVERQIGQR